MSGTIPDLLGNSFWPSWRFAQTTGMEEKLVALGTASLVLASKIAENPASMIWYLLYPLRGTTEAPILDEKHPLRIAFTRYGYKVARNPVITLLVFIATAVVSIFPFPFLYTNDFTSGSSNLPHHVWTSAQPFEGPPTTSADVVMRSVWVHGSYMKALQADVFLSALEIQDYLLGQTVNFDPRRPRNRIYKYNPKKDLTNEMRDNLHTINGLRNESWFFHSPLQYWSCSKEKIESDEDILMTINQSSRQATSLNVTLRHSIVFSGKKFEEHRLVAADALVITLIHMSDSPVGKQWERKAEELALEKSSKWRIYPDDGRSRTSLLYEFRFQPLSLQDDLFLGIAYGLTIIYFVITLSKIRALKSRAGLIIAVIVHISVSIMASFTVCAFLKVDLSQIPREIYPLVVLTVGLENIFRLINAVIMTHSEDSTATQIGEALGKTGHVALAGVCQNLAILWILSQRVYPQITAFCTFAAIALSFDFFFLLTFFVAVLSVDVKRMELSDALSKATKNKSQQNSSVSVDHNLRRTWIDALFRGETSFSARTAGTFVMVGFILMAQWHFFDNESLFRTVSRLLYLFKSGSLIPQTKSALFIDLHQARTPNAWLRMQDHETAREVIQIVKPHANSYIARVYDPLVFVLNGSDRTPNYSGGRPFLPAAYDFAKHQFGVFLFTVFFIVAAVSLFLSYLLWDELYDAQQGGRLEDDPLISISTLNKGHTLDIVLLATSNDGILLTVGLDRWMRLWNLRNKATSCVVYDQDMPLDPFPILAITIDSGSRWLAILSANDVLYLWNIPEQKWGPSMHIKVGDRTPTGFFFGHKRLPNVINPIVLIRKNGQMSVLQVDEGKEKQIQICPGPLLSVRWHLEKPLVSSNHTVEFLAVSKNGSVYVVSQTRTDWVSKHIEVRIPAEDQKIINISPIPNFGLFLAVRKHSVDLVNTSTGVVSHTFLTQLIQPSSLKYFYTLRRRGNCGLVGIYSFAIAYNCSKTGNCIMQVYLPRKEGEPICTSDPCSLERGICCPWNDLIENRFEIENPGRWEALQSGFLVGVRKCERRNQVTGNSSTLRQAPIVRRRGISFSQIPPGATQGLSSEQELWEAWAISARGERFTRPLCCPQEQDHLLISNLGPLQVMGRYSIAVAFGNMAKIISVGIEKFDGDENLNDDASYIRLMTRRKRPCLAKRKSQ
ncbi:hypothetical protein K3495_g4552 [Podosphaera aphanis]|nr:hypothetical protein K3495_g4552 [Podosphaera aphanis]